MGAEQLTVPRTVENGVRAGEGADRIDHEIDDLGDRPDVEVEDEVAAVDVRLERRGADHEEIGLAGHGIEADSGLERAAVVAAGDDLEP